MRSRMMMAALAGMLVLQGCAAGPSGPNAPAPPVGRPVVLDTSVPDWTTSAWLAKDTLCVRVARSDGERRKDRENELVFCDPAPSALDTSGPPLLPAKPQPYVAPLDPQQRKTILIGTVRGAVATVSVTMFGNTATTPVHQLPTADGRQVGAYALWLPYSGPTRNGMTLSDITDVVGRDAAGVVVTRLS